MNRLQREAIIVKTMIEYYCCTVHHEKNQCRECSDLIAYTSRKLTNCKFGPVKPVCKDCPIHCYSPEKKQKIRDVMQWAGPRMIYRYPLYALIHIYDTYLNKPHHEHKNKLT